MSVLKQGNKGYRPHVFIGMFVLKQGYEGNIPLMYQHVLDLKHI